MQVDTAITSGAGVATLSFPPTNLMEQLLADPDTDVRTL